MPHPLDHHRLPGIGPLRLARLEEVGIHTLEAFMATSIEDLSALPGFHRSMVERARDAAQAILSAPPPAPLPDVPDVPLPGMPPVPQEDTALVKVAPHSAEELERPRKPLRRGLKAARRVETSLDGVRRARAHAKTRDTPEHDRLGKELKKMRRVLVRAQREALTHGLSHRALDDLDELLDLLDGGLNRFADRKPKRKRSEQLRTRVQVLRKALLERIR